MKPVCWNLNNETKFETFFFQNLGNGIFRVFLFALFFGTLKKLLKCKGQKNTMLQFFLENFLFKC